MMQGTSFWDAYGADVQKSEVKTLTLANAPFETVCEQPTFLDEFTTLNDYVVNYLATDACVERLVTYLTDMTEQQVAQYTKKCHYPYFAFTIFSMNNTRVYDKLFSRPDLLLRLFAISSQDPETHVTAQGYIAAMFKSWMSPQNSKPKPLVEFLEDNFGGSVLPLAQNLSTSNADIVRELLTCRSESLSKMQDPLFQYLIYFYLSEKFDRNFLVRNPDTFENLYAIFRYLTEVKISYPYARDYIPNLWSNLEVQNDFAREDLLILRVQTLKYLARTGQIAVFPANKAIYAVVQSFRNPHKARSFLKVFLEFLVLVTSNQNAIPQVHQPMFLAFLVDVLGRGSLDIIAAKVFAVFENCLPWIFQNPKTKSFFFQFVMTSLTQQSQLQPFSYKPNSQYISLHFWFKLLTKIDGHEIEPKFAAINEWQKRLEDRYKKLAFDSVDGESMISRKNSIQFDLKQDIEFFAEGEGLRKSGGLSGSQFGGSSSVFAQTDPDKLKKAFETKFPESQPPSAGNKDFFAGF